MFTAASVRYGEYRPLTEAQKKVLMHLNTEERREYLKFLINRRDHIFDYGNDQPTVLAFLRINRRLWELEQLWGTRIDREETTSTSQD